MTFQLVEISILTAKKARDTEILSKCKFQGDQINLKVNCIFSNNLPQNIRHLQDHLKQGFQCKY